MNKRSSSVDGPPSPRRNIEPRAPNRARHIQRPWLLIIVGVAATATIIMVFQRRHPAPCAVQCLDTALLTHSKQVDDTVLKAAYQLVETGSLTISRDESRDAAYRAVVDPVLLEMVNTCSHSCTGVNQQALRVNEAWARVHVRQQTGKSRSLSNAAGARVSTDKGDGCTAGVDGRCDLRLGGVELIGELRFTAEREGNVVEARVSVGAAIRGGVELTLPPPPAVVTVLVMREGSGERLPAARVELRAPKADVWGTSCGAELPPQLTSCEAQQLTHGEARFYVLGEPDELEFTVVPEAEGPPKRFTVAYGPSSYTLEYPAKVSAVARNTRPPSSGLREESGGSTGASMTGSTTHGNNSGIQNANRDAIYNAPPPGDVAEKARAEKP